MLYREGRVGLGGAKIFFGCGAGGLLGEAKIFFWEWCGRGKDIFWEWCGRGRRGMRGKDIFWVWCGRGGRGG